MIEKIKEFGIDPNAGRASPPVAKKSDGLESPSYPANDLGTIRDYQLLAQLGQGGMGTVYKALHTQLDKLVALKVLPADRMHDQAVARFKREMKAVGKLHHANIVQAFDAGEHQGRHFLVMELVEGTDLANLVRAHGRLKIADACELARQTALALEYVRQHGMVHRDIKPSNLVLSASGQVKVLDLGLALLHDPAHEGEELTSASATMGTADYVAPEQTGDSHNVDIRADIYSLGCTLYKLLSGDAPYVGPTYKTPLQKMMAHLGQPFPDVRTARPEVSAELKAVLERMVAKEPSGRYATPAEVAAALAPFCVGHDLVALASAPVAVKPQVDSSTSTIRGDKPIAAGLEETIASDIAVGQASPPAIPKKSSLAGGDARPTRPPRNRNLLLALAAGGLAILLGVIVMLQTRHGTLVLTVEGPPPVIKVDGEQQEFTLDKDGKTYRIRVAPGGHELSVTTPDGTEFATPSKEFSVKWGGETTLTARLEEKEAPAEGTKDPDRAVAEWVLSQSGSLQILINGEYQDIPNGKPLPSRAFSVISVGIDKPNVVRDADIGRLLVASQLTAISLTSQAHLTAVGMQQLENIKTLKVVFLDMDQHLSTKDILPLTKLKLESLSLRALHHVGDDLIPELVRQGSLRNLSLQGTAITDKGLNELASLKSLRILDVRRTKATQGSIEKLAAALPMARIEWDGSTIEPKLDPDRRAAQYVLSIEGSVKIKEKGELRELKAGDDLPSGAFELWAVQLDHNPKVDEAGLKNFAGCRNLRELSLERTPLGKGEALVHFKDCKQLTRLNLSGMPLADSALAHFKDCPQLTHLNLHETSVGDAGLENFAMCENLESLALGRTNTTNEGLAHFNHCKQLAELHIADTKVDDAGLAGLKHRQSLKSLRVERTAVSDLGLANLAECSRLVYLNVTGTKVTEAGVMKLWTALPNCGITWDGGIMGARTSADPDRRAAQWVLSIEGLIQIEQNGEIRQIEPGQLLPEGTFKLRRAALPFSTKFTESGLAAFDGCQNLMSLDLSGLAISDESLLRFKDCRELISLSLCTSKLTDEGFAAFKNCRQIGELSLGQGKFSERALEAFNLKAIGILSLHQCQLSEGIWDRLAACENVAILDLRATGLTDANLERVAKFRKLTYVKLNENKLSEAAMNKLATALPAATIEWDGKTIEPKVQN